jgi:hypothetical protein
MVPILVDLDGLPPEDRPKAKEGVLSWVRAFNKVHFELDMNFEPCDGVHQCVQVTLGDLSDCPPLRPCVAVFDQTNLRITFADKDWVVPNVTAHEFGHALGLDDLYDEFCVMGDAMHARPPTAEEAMLVCRANHLPCN